MASLFEQVRSHGGTPTGTPINQIMKPYLRAHEQAIAVNGDPDNSSVQPVNTIAITDGIPTDDPRSDIAISQISHRQLAPPLKLDVASFQRFALNQNACSVVLLQRSTPEQ